MPDSPAPTGTRRDAAVQALADVPRVPGAPKPDPILDDFRSHDARQSLERHFLSCNAVPPGKPGRAPGAVSAHLSLAAVGIEETHRKISLLRIFHNEYPVRSERASSAAIRSRHRKKIIR